eukprot:TRINITY_DN63905_c1_g4_i1.p1 TRINITY_DN63905_c1_g4~~TRINITY_DN63905_c1_g4_i1.p1  ORF type:complete len:759 (+),score=30.23 TRINITY_DN63905_c1_g4_i1:71-2278(+)
MDALTPLPAAVAMRLSQYTPSQAVVRPPCCCIGIKLLGDTTSDSFDEIYRILRNWHTSLYKLHARHGVPRSDVKVVKEEIQLSSLGGTQPADAVLADVANLVFWECLADFALPPHFLRLGIMLNDVNIGWTGTATTELSLVHETVKAAYFYFHPRKPFEKLHNKLHVGVTKILRKADMSRWRYLCDLYTQQTKDLIHQPQQPTTKKTTTTTQHQKLTAMSMDIQPMAIKIGAEYNDTKLQTKCSELVLDFCNHLASWDQPVLSTDAVSEVESGHPAVKSVKKFTPYHVEQVLATTGLFNAVLQVRKPDTGEAFVIKWTKSKEEADFALRYRQSPVPGVVQILECKPVSEDPNDGWFIITEAGLFTLHQLIKHGADILANAQFRYDLILQLLQGLTNFQDHGTSSAAHMDIKPENYIWTTDHNIALIDFDCARMHPTGVSTPHMPTSAWGTRPWVDPEALDPKNSTQVSRLADSWALGATIYAFFVPNMQHAAWTNGRENSELMWRLSQNPQGYYSTAERAYGTPIDQLRFATQDEKALLQQMLVPRNSRKYPHELKSWWAGRNRPAADGSCTTTTTTTTTKSPANLTTSPNPAPFDTNQASSSTYTPTGSAPPILSMSSSWPSAQGSTMQNDIDLEIPTSPPTTGTIPAPVQEDRPIVFTTSQASSSAVPAPLPTTTTTSAGAPVISDSPPSTQRPTQGGNPSTGKGKSKKSKSSRTPKCCILQYVMPPKLKKPK